MEPTRRGFLFGAVATIAAATLVRPLQLLEIAEQPSEKWRRVSATFKALDEGRFSVAFGGERFMEAAWGQLEYRLFATSYIPTMSSPGYRAPDTSTPNGFVRQTGATQFNDKTQLMETVAPNVLRQSARGALYEGQSTNYLRYSDRPRDQIVKVPRGTLTFSCYVRGQQPVIRITGEDGRVFVPVLRVEEAPPRINYALPRLVRNNA